MFDYDNDYQLTTWNLKHVLEGVLITIEALHCIPPYYHN